MTTIDNWFVAGGFVKTAADPASTKYVQRFYDSQREQFIPAHAENRIG